MKFLIATFLLIPQLVFAGDITITPGSQITVSAGVDTNVSCSGKTEQSYCSLRHVNDVYYITIDGKQAGPLYYTLSDAIDYAEKIRKANFCL